MSVYRARDAFITSCNRIWQRGGSVAERAVPRLWADAWQRAGELGPPNQDDLTFAYAYAQNPHGLGSERGRHLRRPCAREPPPLASEWHVLVVMPFLCRFFIWVVHYAGEPACCRP